MQQGTGQAWTSRGLIVPCVFWPGSYVPQEIQCIAVSPDGAVVAGACLSGQVYIWACRAEAAAFGGSVVQLDPAAVVLSGWLGSSEVIGLDFCNIPAAAEIAGLTTGMLLVCLTRDGQLRVVDPVDGRCIAVTAHLLGQSTPTMLRVLKDGRHVVVVGKTGEQGIIDLWTSSLLETFGVPSYGSPKQLVGPRCCGGREAGPSRAPPCETLQWAGSTATHMILWEWRSRGSSSGKSLTPTPSFMHKMVAGEEVAGLALEDGILLLALQKRLLGWIVSPSGAIGAQFQIQWVGVDGGVPASRLAGVELVSAVATPATVARSRVNNQDEHHRRARSWSPLVRRPCEVVDSVVVVWTEDGRVFQSRVPPLVSESVGKAEVDCCLRLQPWGRFPGSLEPSTLRCCWLRCGLALVALRVGGSARASILVQTGRVQLPPHGPIDAARSWTTVADLRELWPCTMHPSGPTVRCSTMFESRSQTWVALGLGSNAVEAKASVRVVLAASVEEAHVDIDELVLPSSFGEVECLCALGPRYLVAGGTFGGVCWWSLDDTWLLAGGVESPYRALVVHLARVWAPVSGGNSVAPDAAIVAAMDELGKCRLVDLRTGELLCTIQSQSGPSLFLDEPVRVALDRFSRYVVVSTPKQSSTWDAVSGSFEGTIVLAAAAGSDVSATPDSGSEKCIGPPGSERTTFGLRLGSALRQIPHGMDGVAWQATDPTSGAVGVWSLGEAMLDGPSWRLPVVALSACSLVPPGRALSAAGRVGTAAGGSEAVKVSPPWPCGAVAQAFADRLRGRCQVDVSAERSPFLIGTLGVDASLSVPLPQRRGLRRRSESPQNCRRQGVPASPSVAPRPSAAAASQVVLSSLAAQSCDVQLASLMRGSPRIGLVFLARMVLSSDPGPQQQQVLQKLVLPSLRELLSCGDLDQVLQSLRAWQRVLQSRSAADLPPPGCSPLRQGAFASQIELQDAAVVLLAAVARAQPRMFDSHISRQSSGAIADGLRARMLTRSEGVRGVRLQGIACELFAADFARWRRHLGTAGAAQAARTSVAQERAAAASTLAPGATLPAVATVAASSQNTGSESLGTGADEDLDSMAERLLALYQEPRLSPAALAVLMQIGSADPLSLLRVMGRAARRVDLGVAHASSALLVLVAFVRGESHKVVPLLPKFTEIVLRCLEPSDPALRRQSLMAVTSALHELVKTFPMVAFAQQTQKLAVGTSENVVVVYDLRTATKWRIFEGHTGAVSALAFSSDGERLASYSAADHTARVWQCGSGGFLSGLLSNSSRCLKSHSLPRIAPDLLGDSPSGVEWRAIVITWTAQRTLHLVRETGERLHLSSE